MGFWVLGETLRLRGFRVRGLLVRALGFRVLGFEVYGLKFSGFEACFYFKAYRLGGFGGFEVQGLSVWGFGV